MRLRLCVLSVAISFATVSFAQTPPEIRREFAPAAKICSELALEEVTARLLSGWSRCFAGVAKPHSQPVIVGRVPILIPAGPGAKLAVRVERDGDVTTLISEGPEPIGIMFIADVQKTEVCTAEIQIRGASKFANSIAAPAGKFVDAPDAECPRAGR